MTIISLKKIKIRYILILILLLYFLIDFLFFYLPEEVIIPLRNDKSTGALKTVEVNIIKPADMDFEIEVHYIAHPKYLREKNETIKEKCANYNWLREEYFLDSSTEIHKSEPGQKQFSISLPVNEGLFTVNCEMKIDYIWLSPSDDGMSRSGSINKILIVFIREGENYRFADLKISKKLPSSRLKMECKKQKHKNLQDKEWFCKDGLDKKADSGTSRYHYRYKADETSEKLRVDLDVRYY